MLPIWQHAPYLLTVFPDCNWTSRRFDLQLTPRHQEPDRAFATQQPQRGCNYNKNWLENAGDHHHHRRHHRVQLSSLNSDRRRMLYFSGKRNWHDDALKMQNKWDLPLHVPMAIMYHESKFRRKAKPPRRYLLGFIPWKRRSSAYGYAQAVDGTWKTYTSETNNKSARRTDFTDALDFMGWYLSKSSKIADIGKDDTYRQYLAYHEGWTGYKRQSYKQKEWLIQVAQNAASLSDRYKKQYQSCESDLNKSFWSRFKVLP